MFKSAGKFKATLREVVFAEAFFKDAPPDAIDVCLKFDGPEGQSDWWRGELSGRYGVGNASHKTQTEMTMGSLRAIGFKGDDLTKLNDLIGVETDVTTEAYTSNKDGKTYYNIKYIGDSFAPKALDKSTLKSRLDALMGGSNTHDAAEPAPQEDAGW